MKKLFLIGLISSSIVLGGCFRRIEIPETQKQVHVKSESEQVSLSGSDNNQKIVTGNNESFWKNIQSFKCQRPKESQTEWTQLEGAKQPFFFIDETCQSLNNSGSLSIVTVPYTDIYIIRRTGSGAKPEIAETHYKGFGDRSYTEIYRYDQDTENIFRQILKNSQAGGFQKRTEDIIPILFTNYSLTHDTAPYLKKEKNIRYCENPVGNKSLCLVDITLQYDFVKNIVRETGACTYYLDTANKSKKVLEPCFQF
ncbi:MAG: hypothetical protein PHH70_02125 [Candidatus Gracilibacteria bacterium]|nr:hypothetical protein [Candidatus Gracilibacteria bacterium]